MPICGTKRDKMAKLSFPTWTVPLALLVASVFSYGVLIPWLGFFWDDWPSIWFLHFLGPRGFIDVFAIDRPLLGRLFLITTNILGESTVLWQAFGVITRWISSVALWWTLKSVWPSRIEEASWVALLFTVYTGFSQQFISVTYSHVFVVMTAFWVSLGHMVWALRNPGWFWPLTAFSVLLSAYSLFSVEYFFGLELIRPIIIWIVLKDKYKDTRKRLGNTILQWSPYLIILITFFLWRMFFQETPRGEVVIFEKLQTAPLATLLDLTQEIFIDIIEVSVLAWVQTINLLKLINFGLLATISYGVITVLAGIFVYFYLSRFKPSQGLYSDQINSKNIWIRQAIGLGVFSLLIAGWPFWATNLPIELDFPWDRFTLPMMFGSCLLLVGVISLFARNHTQKMILVTIFISLGIGWQFRNANIFRREWNTQKSFFWQLSWRAPEIEPGTLLLASELPFTYFSDNSLTAPLNWMYSPDTLPTPMPQLLYSIESRLGKSLPDLKPDLEIYEPYRATGFSGSTSQAIVLYYAPPGCVKILDPAIDARLPQKPKFISDAMKLSKPNLIRDSADQAIPPMQYFGPEPAKDWCYYFEKADLARQIADWDQVVALSNQAFELGQQLYEINAPEYLPYIEGHAQAGNWEPAIFLTEEAYRLNQRMQRIICATWIRIARNTPDSLEKNEAITEIQNAYQCEIQ